MITLSENIVENKSADISVDRYGAALRFAAWFLQVRSKPAPRLPRTVVEQLQGGLICQRY